MHEIKINDRITAVLTYDQDAEYPAPHFLGKIYYLKRSRYLLGTEAVDSERMREINVAISAGELVGLPVYAYVHGGVELSTKPFSCPFDSGLSGFIACSREEVESWFGKDVPEERVLEVLRSEVEVFNKYLAGDVYNITIRVDGKDEATVGGFFGFDYAVEEAKVLAEGYVKHLERTVKVYFQTSTEKLPVMVNADFITKLEKCVSLIQEMGGGEVHLPAIGQNMATYHWKVEAGGARLVTTLADVVQNYGNLVEISKFHQMHAGQPAEGFNKVGDYCEGVYYEEV